MNDRKEVRKIMDRIYFEEGTILVKLDDKVDNKNFDCYMVNAIYGDLVELHGMKYPSIMCVDKADYGEFRKPKLSEVLSCCNETYSNIAIYTNDTNVGATYEMLDTDLKNYLRENGYTFYSSPKDYNVINIVGKGAGALTMTLDDTDISEIYEDKESKEMKKKTETKFEANDVIIVNINLEPRKQEYAVVKYIESNGTIRVTLLGIKGKYAEILFTKEEADKIRKIESLAEIDTFKLNREQKQLLKEIKKSYDSLKEAAKNIEEKNKQKAIIEDPEVVDIKVSVEKQTVVLFWNDNTVTKANCHEDDTFDLEKGVAVAMAKKHFSYEELEKYTSWAGKVYGKEKKKVLPFDVKDVIIIKTGNNTNGTTGLVKNITNKDIDIDVLETTYGSDKNIKISLGDLYKYDIERFGTVEEYINSKSVKLDDVLNDVIEAQRQREKAEKEYIKNTDNVLNSNIDAENTKKKTKKTVGKSSTKSDE